MSEIKISRYLVGEWICFLIYILIFNDPLDIWGFSGIIPFLLLSLVLLLIWLEFKYSEVFSSPILFWYAFWLLPIVIARVPIERWIAEINWSRELIDNITGCNIAFFVTYQILNILSIRPISGLGEGRIKNSISCYRVLVSILVLDVIAFIMNCIYTRCVPLLSGDANAVRGAFIRTPLFSFINVTRFAVSIAPYYVVRTRIKKRKKIILLLLLILEAEMVLTGWRSMAFQVMVMFLTGLFLTIYSRSKDIYDRWSSWKSKHKQMRIIFVAILFGLFVIGYVAAKRANKSLGIIGSQIVYSLYNYVAPNFLHYQNALERLEPAYDPVYTLPLIRAFKILLELPVHAEFDFSTIMVPSSVATYLLYAYCDFGKIGTIIWTMVFAALSVLGFNRAKKKPDPMWYTLTGLMNAVIFTLHNGFILRSVGPLVWIIITIILSKMGIFEDKRLNNKSMDKAGET